MNANKISHFLFSTTNDSLVISSNMFIHFWFIKPHSTSPFIKFINYAITTTRLLSISHSGNSYVSFKLFINFNLCRRQLIMYSLYFEFIMRKIDYFNANIMIGYWIRNAKSLESNSLIPKSVQSIFLKDDWSLDIFKSDVALRYHLYDIHYTSSTIKIT